MASTETVEDTLDMFKQWTQSGTKTLTLFVLGKTGVGKTTLINTLLGDKMAPVRKGSSKEADTMKLDRYKKKIGGVTVKLWDSRGLQDGARQERHVLIEIRARIEEINPDIMIYCHKMDVTRFHSDDTASMKLVTSWLGNNVWNNTVVALTFANNVVVDVDVDDDDAEDLMTHFNNELAVWNKTIKDCLQKEVYLPSETVDKIKLTPTATNKIKRLPKGSQDDEEGSILWLPEFWSRCFDATKPEARLNWVHITKGCHFSTLTKEQAIRVAKSTNEALQNYAIRAVKEWPFPKVPVVAVPVAAAGGAVATGSVVATLGGAAAAAGAGILLLEGMRQYYMKEQKERVPTPCTEQPCPEKIAVVAGPAVVAGGEVAVADAPVTEEAGTVLLEGMRQIYTKEEKKPVSTPFTEEA